ncbi:hypothetical protein B8A18_09195 [Staphylococcus aureus]|nr:hypothetical protein B7983_13260 [Staphylococcus aureus]ORN65762.1 hypothetical protein B8A18_09195 [Staphylococcus aureus]ORN68018.1 hypothetical protein B8A17_13830 [Staphylococcus aureus]
MLCVGALTPTCTLLKADYWPASVLGPRQLALSVEFLFEILCVGALTPTCTLLKADYWPASVLGPLPQLAHY